jgi:hypothetical protein
VENVEAGIPCNQTVTETTGSMEGICELGIAGRCLDGTYSIKCSCPEATCFCTQSSSTSAVEFTVPFAAGCLMNCSAASIPVANEACGFPLP